MTVMGMTITRHDGSTHSQTEHHGREPRKGDVIETEDATGKLIRARIESIHHELPK